MGRCNHSRDAFFGTLRWRNLEASKMYIYVVLIHGLLSDGFVVPGMLDLDFFLKWLVDFCYLFLFITFLKVLEADLLACELVRFLG